jgi:hypothetical protein
MSSPSLIGVTIRRRAVPALREAVATLYNETYRHGRESKYTKENVCIVPGTFRR